MLMHQHTDYCSCCFNSYHSSLWGSRCQFLSRLIIALLASPCNGPLLSNPEHRVCAMSLTKDDFIDPPFPPSLSLCKSHFSIFSWPVVIFWMLSFAFSYCWVHMTACNAKLCPWAKIFSWQIYCFVFVLGVMHLFRVDNSLCVAKEKIYNFVKTVMAWLVRCECSLQLSWQKH